MKIALLQTDICWANPEHNIAEAQQLIDSCETSDLYVLPEMWSTGFATVPQGIAHDDNDNLPLQWMKQTAQKRQCAICGSLAIRQSDGNYYNRHYFVDGRSETVSSYDKHHLFTYGKENDYYTAGQSHTIVNYAGFRFMLITCYDLRFPCWIRYATGREYDAIICVANWPESRQLAWQVLTRARAIENQCYMIAANRVGDDQYSHYAGLSAVIDPLGHTIARCQRNRVQALVAEIDIETLQRHRQKFRVLDDRDR